MTAMRSQRRSRTVLIAAALGALGALGAGSATAQTGGVYVRSVRIAATDPQKVAAFYEKAFGMVEVRRLDFPNMVEIIVNAGADKAAAAANPHAPIVIQTRQKAVTVVGEMANLILNVPDMDKATAAVEAAGGSIARKTAKLQDGTTFAFAKDPEGNQIELLLGK